jgi:hypothetical protein
MYGYLDSAQAHQIWYEKLNCKLFLNIYMSRWYLLLARQPRRRLKSVGKISRKVRGVFVTIT